MFIPSVRENKTSRENSPNGFGLIQLGFPTGNIRLKSRKGFFVSQPLVIHSPRVFLRLKILDYQPDLVIMACNESDLSEVIVKGGFKRFQPESTVKINPAPWWEVIYEHSFLFRAVMAGAFQYDSYLLIPKSDIHQKFTESADSLMVAVDSIKSLCDKNGVPLLLVFHPTLREIETDSLYLDKVLIYAQAKGFNTINLLDYFEAAGVNPANLSAYYWPKDGHHKAAGYELFACGVAEYFSNHDLIRTIKSDRSGRNIQ